MNLMMRLRHNDPHRIGRLLLVTGIVPLVFMAANVAAASIEFAIGFSLSYLPALLAAGLAVAVCILGSSHYSGIRRVRVVVALVLVQIVILLTAILISSSVFDMSYDGQWYHQDAIIRLRNGWNPVRDFAVNSKTNDEDSIYTDTKVKTYTKGPWITAATIYFLTNRIESGKANNIWLIAATFSLALGALTYEKSLSFVHKFIAASLIALNPVSIYQIFSFYVDGQVASILACLIILLCMWIFAADALVSIGLVASIILLCNAKFTATLYAIIFVAGAVTWLLLQKRRLDGLRLTQLSVAAFALAIFAGANPYITNTITYHNPLYPVMNRDSSIIDGERPANFDNLSRFEDGERPANFDTMNRAERLLYSIFSRSENVKSPRNATLKLPFSLASEPNQFGIFSINRGTSYAVVQEAPKSRSLARSSMISFSGGI